MQVFRLLAPIVAALVSLPAASAQVTIRLGHFPNITHAQAIEAQSVGFLRGMPDPGKLIITP